MIVLTMMTNMQDTISRYTFAFQHLTTAKIAGKQAPHKAILLLSVMELIETGVIKSRRFELSDRLENTFERIWKRYIGTSLIFQPKVATPFWHMQNEPFYQLSMTNGQDTTGMKANYSVKWLRENTYATIDKDLYELMKDENARAQLRVNLVSAYLKDLHPTAHPGLQHIILFALVVNLSFNTVYGRQIQSHHSMRQYALQGCVHGGAETLDA